MIKCPIQDLDFYGEWRCEHYENPTYKTCHKCAKRFLGELKYFIKELKKEKKTNE